MVKNKKAWLRIVEAIIAILIIAGATLIILSKQSKDFNIMDERIYEKQTRVLELISKNESLRNDIIIGRNEEVNKAIKKMIPNSWNFTIVICGPDEICNSENTPNDKEVYSTEIIVTSNLTFYNATKLRFLVWMK